MKKSGVVDKSSLLLGMGTGIIIASIAWLLFIMLSNPNDLYDKNKIMEAAQQFNEFKEKNTLQTEEKQQIVFNFDEEKNNDNAEDKNEKNVEDNEKSEDVEDIKSNKPIQITVLPGDLCSDIDRKLYEAGIIEKENVFNNRMKELKLTTKINAGVFEIIPGEDLDTIISKLVKSYKIEKR